MVEGSTVPAAGRRVIVIDDNERAATALEVGLRLLGHTVAIALEGDQALRLAESFHPDVAVIDIRLPGMDGYELARRLRERHQIILIAVTGFGDDSDRDRARDAGFEHHLVKPVDLQQLAALLRSE
jgi:CheY-like chemotaxis protein